jgi:hypothetical protein
MPFNPTAPETKSIVTTTENQVTLDTFDILRFDMNFNPNNPMVTYVDVTWLEGYMNEGQFVEAERHLTRLAGPEFLAAVMVPADSGSSVYANVKNTLWNYMIAQGIVPAGSIV